MSSTAIVNPDLQLERSNATFDVEEFKTWWHGGYEKFRQKKEIENLFLKHATVNHTMEYLSFKDVYDQSVKQTIEVIKKLRYLQTQRDPKGDEIWPKLITSDLLHSFMPDSHPFVTHATMFVDAIMNQGTPEQIKRFGIPAKDFRIIGTYAQTEFSHGTHVRGIQTRADFDRETDEFVLNTPTLRDYKCWAGGMGHTCNHALVVAQLYIDNVHKGLQMFIVRIRHENTHMPIDGVHVGELGKKLGMAAVNQGYLGLKNVRIPRINMLMKNAQVLRDGSFKPSASDKVTYLTLIYMRCFVADLAIQMMQKAVTIATRYSVVRRQSPIEENTDEPKILDHITQAFKLLPELSKSVVYKVACNQVWRMYEKTLALVKNGNFEQLAEMHIIACVVKVLGTSDSVTGIERARFACGGFGYLAAANFGKLYGETIAMYTYDGENTVLLLQIGRFLMKWWQQLQKNQADLPASLNYLVVMSKLRKFPLWNNTREHLLTALQFTATNKTRLASEKLSRHLVEGRTAGEAFNLASIEIMQAAELHGRQMVAAMMSEMLSGLERAPWSNSLRDVLRQLYELHMLTTIQRYMGDLLQCIPLTQPEIKGLQARLEVVLQQLRVNAVAICDGFDFHDAVLNSVLGCYDGNVYERIFESTKESPLNAQPVQESFEKYLKPFLTSKF